MKQWTAAFLAVLMIASFPGCSKRRAPAPKEEAPLPPAQEEPIPPAEPKENPSEQVPPAQPDDPQQEPKTPEGNPLPPANPAAVTDLSAYAGLDGGKLGWGPGGPVDEHNRSQGAVAYQEKYGKYDADFIGEDEKTIYLTFDEGYENGHTAEILDVLKEKNCPAVFFVTGQYAKEQQELIRRMIDEGHIVGNHSMSHPSFPDTPLSQCKEEVEGLHRYVKDTYDYEMSLFRFPMGEFSEQDLKLLQDMGYRSVFWSFAYRDWEVDNQMSQAEAKETILSKAHPGAIYLLHAVSDTNAKILGDVIDELRDDGYEFAVYGSKTRE